MKKITFLSMLLLIPSVFAIYGGEKLRFNFPMCDELIINITGSLPIDEGEYTILNNCTENSTNYWICDCNDNYYLNISFKTNTVNNYNFTFNYGYTLYVGDQQPSSNGGGSGSSSGSFTSKLSNKSRTFMLKLNMVSRFWINNESHTIRIITIGNDWVEVLIESEPITLMLNKDETKEIDFDDETLKLTLKEIRGKISFIEFVKLKKEIITQETTIQEIITNVTMGNISDVITEQINKTIDNSTNIFEVIDDIKMGVLSLKIIIIIVCAVLLIPAIVLIKKNR